MSQSPQDLGALGGRDSEQGWDDSPQGPPFLFVVIDGALLDVIVVPGNGKGNTTRNGGVDPGDDWIVTNIDCREGNSLFLFGVAICCHWFGWSNYRNVIYVKNSPGTFGTRLTEQGRPLTQSDRRA